MYDITGDVVIVIM